MYYIFLKVHFIKDKKNNFSLSGIGRIKCRILKLKE